MAELFVTEKQKPLLIKKNASVLIMKYTYHVLIFFRMAGVMLGISTLGSIFFTACTLIFPDIKQPSFIKYTCVVYLCTKTFFRIFFRQNKLFYFWYVVVQTNFWLHDFKFWYKYFQVIVICLINILQEDSAFLYFLVAKLLYDYKCPSFRTHVPMLDTFRFLFLKIHLIIEHSLNLLSVCLPGKLQKT